MAAHSGGDATRQPTRRACSVLAASLAMSIAGVFLGACATSPEPHARMSAAEIETRVEDEFPVGTPRDAVIERLHQRGANYDAPLPLDQPAGWTTLRLYLDQPWWAGLEWATTYRKTEAWADMLFDEGDVLRDVQGELRERTW